MTTVLDIVDRHLDAARRRLGDLHKTYAENSSHVEQSWLDEAQAQYDALEALRFDIFILQKTQASAEETPLHERLGRKPGDYMSDMSDDP